MSRKSIFIALMSLSLFAASESKAAFPVKRSTIATTEVVSQSATATLTNEPTTTLAEQGHVTKKHSLLNRLAHKAEDSAAIPLAAYIILAVIGFGWLAIGLNDSFEGASWLISLLLYILFYLPGLIYTLIVMGDYY